MITAGLTAAVAVSVLAAAPGRAAGPPVPTLLRDGRASPTSFFPAGISGDPTVQPNTQIEPSIAVNPANPLNIAAGFQVGRVDGGGDATNGYAVTLDGGHTWTDGLLPGLTKDGPRPPASPFDRASDAVVAFGPDGTLYYSSLVFDDTSNNALRSAMAINVSKDGGLHWTDGVILEQDNLGGFNDKNWIVVDQLAGTGHHKGRVYVVWDRVDPVVYSYCDSACDVLTNWSSAATNGSTGLANGFYPMFAGPGIGSMPVIQNDGTLNVFFRTDPAVPSVPPTDQPPLASTAGTPVKEVFAPAAGAVVWPAPLTFSNTPIVVGVIHSINSVPGQRAGGLPTAAIDPVSNQIYVGWEDSAARTSDGRNDAVFVTSADKGLTWSAMKVIDTHTDGSYVDDYNTALAVGPDGIVRAMYRSRLEAGATFSKTIDTYYQQSADHGATWSAPLKVDTKPTDTDYAAYSRGGVFQGDYNQIAVGPDNTAYLVRDESYAPTAGAPCSCRLSDPPSVHQFQTTWVAVVAPVAPGAAVADVPWVPALVLVGAGAMWATLRRRNAHIAD
jgi:hypothetical protein